MANIIINSSFETVSAGGTTEVTIQINLDMAEMFWVFIRTASANTGTIQFAGGRNIETGDLGWSNGERLNPFVVKKGATIQCKQSVAGDKFTVGLAPF